MVGIVKISKRKVINVVFAGKYLWYTILVVKRETKERRKAKWQGLKLIKSTIITTRPAGNWKYGASMMIRHIQRNIVNGQQNTTLTASQRMKKAILRTGSKNFSLDYTGNPIRTVGNILSAKRFFLCW